MKKTSTLLALFILLSVQNLYSQCTVNVDTLNISHIVCPNGGSVGAAQIIQSTYLNYSWQNVTNGQLYNGGGGNGGTIRADLDAGFYVITASSPYFSSCPDTIYSDTFEIKMPIVNIQSNPTQACPNECNVMINMNLINPITPNFYTYSIDALSPLPVIDPFLNLCGGPHTYEVFANGQSCGIENFGISQLAAMNLSTSVIDATCTQSGSATVNITGVGASSLNNYCLSSPQYLDYSTINNVSLVGDIDSITNNTSSICNLYSDFTTQSADVTPGNSYTLDIDLGTCHIGGFALVDIANIFVDWNIDGDFDDVNEIIATIDPTQSPSSHTINFIVPTNAIPGQSRMRVVMQNNQYQPSNQADDCINNIAWFGETEDYTIVVTGSVATPVTYLWSDGQTTQTATNLSAGTYYIIITDANGCSATDTAMVAGQSNVSVTASGTQTICNGGVPLPLSSTSPNNGVNYSWSPSSDFLNSNVQNPVFSNGLINTTTYTVTCTSVNGCISTDQVTITVNPIPTSILSTVPNPACLGDDIVLTASTSIPVNRYKFQYNMGSAWVNISTPSFNIINPVTFSNISTTTQFRVKVREDNGCTNSIWSPIITVPINTIVTPPISHN